MNELSFEQQLEILERQFPLLFALHKLMLPSVVGGGGEAKFKMLANAMIEFNRSNQTGGLYIDYNKGHINKIDVKVRISDLPETP